MGLKKNDKLETLHSMMKYKETKDNISLLKNSIIKSALETSKMKDHNNSSRMKNTLPGEGIVN